MCLIWCTRVSDPFQKAEQLHPFAILNLIFILDNIPSLSIWDQLGFQRVGVIPKAGRLKTGPNGSEEYVDAVIIYKSLV